MPYNTFSFEANLSGERIYKILSQAILNVKILTALEKFNKRNWEALKPKLNPRDFITIIQICKKYFKTENLPYGSDEKIYQKSPTDRQIKEGDSEIHAIMTILNKNKEATAYCLSIPISLAAYTFIECMEKLQEYLRECINKTAEMEKKRTNHLKMLYENNVAMSETLVKLQNKIDLLESHKKTIQSAKESDLTRHNYEIESMRQKFNAKVKDKIMETENQMIIDWKNSEFRQTTLIEEVNQQEMYFQNIMKESLAKEKELRIRRYKVESQLVAVLEQYDNDIGDRHRQKEELSAQLEEEKLELEQLQERFAEQEITYNNLMVEKELYEKRILDEKIFAVRSKIAARTIQRCFRKYMERRAKGKKRGKGKGKGKKK